MWSPARKQAKRVAISPEQKGHLAVEMDRFLNTTPFSLAVTGEPSAFTGSPRVNRAVCACCAHPAIAASKLTGLLSSCVAAYRETVEHCAATGGVVVHIVHRLKDRKPAG